ncbi:MAG: LolA family protein [Planctomycetota bacterium]
MRAVAAACVLLLTAGAGCFGPERSETRNQPAEVVAYNARRLLNDVQRVEAAARVTTETPEHGGSFDADIAIERPYRFRMFAFAHGTEIFDLLLDGTAMSLYAIPDNTVIKRTLGARVEAPPAGLEKLVGVEKLFAETNLPKLLLGNTRFDKEEEWRQLDRDEEFVRFGIFVNGQQRGEVVVEDRSHLIRQYTITPQRPGGPDLVVRYNRWAEVDVTDDAGNVTTVWWPAAIEMESKQLKFYMAFWFSDVRANQKLPDDAFEQDIPEDAKVRGE